MNVIVAVSENGVIGFKNQLPWRIPEDLINFKKLTIGNTVVMGRNTYESIGKPLPRRKNIVLSRTISEIPGCTVCDSLEKAIAETDGELFIIGGQKIYELAEPLATKLYLTLVHKHYDGDAYFNYDLSKWNLQDRVQRDGYSFETHIR